MRSAEARLSASTMTSNSIRLSLVGAQVDCTTKTSRAHVLLDLDRDFAVGEAPHVGAQADVQVRAISAASAGLALPVKTMKSGLRRVHGVCGSRKIRGS
jgi:hypothetical protein